ncbi:MAG: DMT family transporter [Eubacteriales bacterium]|nr:DMT family transporter [Eubacteriales bacterium]
MIYLILAVLSSASVAVAMRIGKKFSENNLTMLAVNYASCTVLAGIFAGTGRFVPEQSSIGLGILQGILYLVSFLLYQYNIRRNGVVLSSTYMKLGVLVPTLAAVFLFGEMPSGLQIAGVVLSIFAIILMNYEKVDDRIPIEISLLLLLIGGGAADVMAKVYEQYGDADRKEQYIFIIFLTAMILCSALAAYRREKITIPDIVCGILIGVPNYFSAVFLLRAVHYVLAAIVYSTYSIATIACTSLTGVLLFKEKLKRKQWIGLIILLGALGCLNY